MKELKIFYITRLIIGVTTFSIILLALAVHSPSKGVEQSNVTAQLINQLEQYQLEYNQKQLNALPKVYVSNAYSHFQKINIDSTCFTCSVISHCMCKPISM